MATDGARPTVLAAARNNAEWCDIVCATHGISGTFHADAWTSAQRTPRLYPDAVTLAADVDVARLLASIDTSAGCSVKDTFATLDLTAHGFRVLFDAQWIMREPAPARAFAPPPADVRFQPVQSAEDLARWEHAWNAEVRGLFQPALLESDTVTVLAAFDNEQIVAGAIMNRSETVVGVSNLFSTTRSPADAWKGCLAHIAGEHPDLAVVGYETGDTLDAALTNGFTALGPLRVLVRER